MKTALNLMASSRYFVVLALVFASTAFSSELSIAQGYSDMYNLRFEDAHRTFASYERLKPKDPLGPVSDAAAYLFSEFDRLHILQSKFFVNRKNTLTSKKRDPDPNIRARFEHDLDETQRLSELQIQIQGERANAMFAQTLALGLHADYLALIEGRDMAALAELKKGRELSEELITDHPKYYDAYLAVGVENYLLSLKPAPLRWILRASGAQTDKQIGLEKLRLTAEHGQYLKPYARLLLAVAALRDGDQKTARDLLSWLATQYPQNNLYREELAKLR